MTWHQMDDSTAIADFMELFGGFHDSCLKELYMWTETFVDEDLDMSMSTDLDACARILFQRQAPAPSAVELLFKGVMNFHICPSSKNSDPVIYSAKLMAYDGQFYWAQDEDWQIDQPFRHSVSWISAQEVYWRDASSWIGERQRYGVLRVEE